MCTVRKAQILHVTWEDWYHSHKCNKYKIQTIHHRCMYVGELRIRCKDSSLLSPWTLNGRLWFLDCFSLCITITFVNSTDQKFIIERWFAVQGVLTIVLTTSQIMGVFWEKGTERPCPVLNYIFVLPRQANSVQHKGCKREKPLAWSSLNSRKLKRWPKNPS